MTDHIICGVDDTSATAERSLRAAARLASELGAALIVIHVGTAAAFATNLPEVGVPVISPGFGLPPGYEDETGDTGKLQRVERDRIDAFVRGCGIDAEVVLIWATSPADGLREAAADRNARLIVVGSHGHGAVRAALLGSTTHGLVSNAPCPVVVVPTSEQETVPSA